jgi:tetratricopeptide (TPR) repeat protein
MKKFLFLSVLLIGVIFFILFFSNNPRNLLNRAKKFEKQKSYDKAEKIYLSLVIKYPQENFVAEAMYNLGNIYKDIKKDYSQSRMWFSQVITKFPTSDYAKFSYVSILESPDYLGLLDGNMTVLGDIESFGKNMKIKTEIKKLDYNLYLSNQNLFAGEKFVREEKRYYLKTNNEIREYLVDPRNIVGQEVYTVVLKYHYNQGMSWTTKKDNKNVTYTIVATDLNLKIREKNFDGCIKVMEKIDGAYGVKYLYYAPNVGCIKITTATLENLSKEHVTVEIIY